MGDVVISPDNMFLQDDCHIHGMVLAVAYLHGEFQITVHLESQIIDLELVLYCLLTVIIYSGLHQQPDGLLGRGKHVVVSLSPCLAETLRL